MRGEVDWSVQQARTTATGWRTQGTSGTRSIRGKRGIRGTRGTRGTRDCAFRRLRFALSRSGAPEIPGEGPERWKRWVAPGMGLLLPGSGLWLPGVGLTLPGSGLLFPSSGLLSHGSGLLLPSLGLVWPGSGPGGVGLLASFEAGRNTLIKRGQKVILGEQFGLTKSG